MTLRFGGQGKRRIGCKTGHTNDVFAKKFVRCYDFFMGKFLDRTNQRYGRLLVVEKTAKRSSSGNVVWNCMCDCGVQVAVSGSSLQQKSTQSCGCFFVDTARNKGLLKRKHGLTNSKIYRVRSKMKNS